MSQLALLNERTGAVVVSHLMVADTFLRRFRGLQFSRGLEEGSGLLLVPCASIHTVWMRFPIDVLFLSKAGQVVQVNQEVAPWRCIVSGKKPHAVLEIASGASNNRIQLGDNLQLVPGEANGLSKRLRFLQSDVPQ